MKRTRRDAALSREEEGRLEQALRALEATAGATPQKFAAYQRAGIGAAERAARAGLSTQEILLAAAAILTDEHKLRAGLMPGLSLSVVAGPLADAVATIYTIVNGYELLTAALQRAGLDDSDA